jgi:3-oxoacyl-[acyl-carrier protein] reductase
MLDKKTTSERLAALSDGVFAVILAIIVLDLKPPAVWTGRRRSFPEKWAPAHNMSVDEATRKFPEEAGISRYGQPEEIAELLAFIVSPAVKWMTGSSVRMDGGEVKGI